MIAIKQANKPIIGLDEKSRTWAEIEQEYVKIVTSDLNTHIMKRLKKIKFYKDLKDQNEKDCLEKFAKLCLNKVSVLLLVKESEIDSQLPDLKATVAQQVNKKFMLELYTELRIKFGHWFANVFGIKVCPYCNNQFVLSIGNDNKALYQLDHYYHKGEYPLLAISVNNLIPSCATCNQAKSTSPSFFNPLTESFHEKAKFALASGKGFVDLSDKRGLATAKLVLAEMPGLSPEDKGKVKKHRKAFKLEGIYNLHKDIVEELYWKRGIYSDSQKGEIKNHLCKFFEIDPTSDIEAELNRFILGNYYKEEDFHKRIHTKLTHDIAKELKLI